MCTISWWWEPAIVIVVGRRTLTGVSMVEIIPYVCGLAIDTTKFLSCEEVSLRRCEITNEPSGVGTSVGVAVAYFDVILLVDERWEMAVAIPPSSACMR